MARIQANVDCAVLSTSAADALFAPVPTTGAGAAKPSPLVLEYPGSLCPAWVLPSETQRLRHPPARDGRPARHCVLPKLPAGDPGGLPEQRIGASRPADQMAYAIDYAPYQVVSILVRA